MMIGQDTVHGVETNPNKEIKKRQERILCFCRRIHTLD